MGSAARKRVGMQPIGRTPSTLALTLHELRAGLRLFTAVLRAAWRLERGSALSLSGRLHLDLRLGAKERAAAHRLRRILVGEQRAENEQTVRAADVSRRSGAAMAEALRKRQRIVAHVWSHSRIPLSRRRVR